MKIPVITIINKFLQGPIADTDILLDTNFFITILAGVVLAQAFQFVLTAISVAGGITAIGNLKENYAKSTVPPDKNSDGHDKFDQDYDYGTSTGVKITSAFGIWSVVTTCIALFGATALAINISVVESEMTNTVTSLVIWGLFFLILFYLETRIASTLIGNLISAATAGLRSSANLITDMVSPSQESKVENMLDSTIDKVRKEFDSSFDTDKISGVLDGFLTKVDKKIPDYNTLKDDLEDIASKSSDTHTAGKWMAIQQVLTKLISENSNSEDQDRKDKAAKLNELMNEVTNKYNAGSDKIDGLENVAADLTPLDKEEIDAKISGLKDYFTSSGKDGMSLDTIKNKVTEVLKNPKVLSSMVSDKNAMFTKENVVKLISNNTNLEKQDVASIAEHISDTVKNLASEFDKNKRDKLIKDFEGKISGFFDSTGGQELDYSKLKSDVKEILDNPKDSLDIIKHRFSTFDIDTLRSLITSNRYINEKDIDSVISTFEGAKKEVQDKVSKIEDKANQQWQMAKRKAVIQAEHTRATAASAAWWLVLSAILSGTAAILGGMLAL